MTSHGHEAAALDRRGVAWGLVGVAVTLAITFVGSDGLLWFDAALLISEDLDEIFALADRIAVMHHGRLTEARPAADWTLAAIGLAMAGSAVQEGAHAA